MRALTCPAQQQGRGSGAAQGCVLGSGFCIAAPLASLIFHSGFASRSPKSGRRNFSGKKEQMVVQRTCCVWGRGGNPDKESSQGPVTWCPGLPVGRAELEGAGFCRSMPLLHRVGHRGSAGSQQVVRPVNQKQDDSGLLWVALEMRVLGNCYPGGEARVREPDQQRCPGFTGPHSSRLLESLASFPWTTPLLPSSREPGHETTVFPLAGRDPAALLSLPGFLFSCLGFLPLEEGQTPFQLLSVCLPHPNPLLLLQVNYLKVNCPKGPRGKRLVIPLDSQPVGRNPHRVFLSDVYIKIRNSSM